MCVRVPQQSPHMCTALLLNLLSTPLPLLFFKQQRNYRDSTKYFKYSPSPLTHIPTRQLPSVPPSLQGHIS